MIGHVLHVVNVNTSLDTCHNSHKMKILDGSKGGDCVLRQAKRQYYLNICSLMTHSDFFSGYFFIKRVDFDKFLDRFLIYSLILAM